MGGKERGEKEQKGDVDQLLCFAYAQLTDNIKSRLSLLMQFIAGCVPSLSTLPTRSEVAFVLFL